MICAIGVLGGDGLADEGGVSSSLEDRCGDVLFEDRCGDLLFED